MNTNLSPCVLSNILRKHLEHFFKLYFNGTFASLDMEARTVTVEVDDKITGAVLADDYNAFIQAFEAYYDGDGYTVSCTRRHDSKDLYSKVESITVTAPTPTAALDFCKNLYHSGLVIPLS